MNVFEINGFAKNYFNYFCFVRPVFGKEEKMSEIVGAYVWFNPDEKLKSDLYRGHSFWIPRFYPPFEMELSTGTRFLLGKKQRKNYFGFVNDIFDKFIYNVNEFKKEWFKYSKNLI